MSGQVVVVRARVAGFAERSVEWRTPIAARVGETLFLPEKASELGGPASWQGFEIESVSYTGQEVELMLRDRDDLAPSDVERIFDVAKELGPKAWGR